VRVATCAVRCGTFIPAHSHTQSGRSQAIFCVFIRRMRPPAKAEAIRSHNHQRSPWMAEGITSFLKQVRIHGRLSNH
jgi:hypothetical protein